MEKSEKYIEVIFSSNKGSRTMASQTANAIESVLQKSFAKVRVSHINDLAGLETLVQKNPDLVFNGIKKMSIGVGKRINVSEYLVKRGLVVTGSTPQVVELENDKQTAKAVVAAAGLATSRYALADIGHEYDADSLSMTFPMFIKPSNRGAGLGISEHSVVRNFEELNANIQRLVADGFADVLIEEYLPGREFSVAVVRGDSLEQYYAAPLELIAPMNHKGDRILGGGIKHADTEKVVVVQDGALKNRLAVFAREVFEALGGRDYGRIDIRLDADGVPQFLEANLMPGLTDHGYLYRCLHLNDGTTYESMIIAIARMALNRKVGARGAMV